MNIKMERAFKKAGISEMPMVRRHIMDNLTKVGADLEKLSSTQIGDIIKALNIGYHDAKGHQEADYMSDMGCVWIGGDVQKIIPIDALKSIETNKHYERDGNINWQITNYKLDFTERC